MQKNKFLTTLSTLTLALGVASAQTTTPAAPATTAAPAKVTTFTDVPAGHWAKDAVDLIVQKGLIQGFPDGSFRGNENLTRYQAALIFYRLLQSGTLGSGSGTDTTTIANGMQEVSTELASISGRVDDLEKLTADQQTRISALETQIATLTAGSASSDTTALTARIDALETAVKNIPAGKAGPQGPAGPAGAAGTAANTTALEARLSALEARVAAQPTTTASTTTSTTTTNNTTNPSTIVIGSTGSTTPTTASNAGRLYVGANYNYSIGGNQTRGSYGAVVGSTQVIGPVGAQVSVDYEPTGGTINADLTATVHLNQGGALSPYAGVGLGLTSSKTRSTANSDVAATTGTSTDYSVGGLVGVDYRFTDSLGVYAEAQGRYYITNNGIGTGLQGNKSGFGSTAKAGLKFFF
ncbi:S-layer homology domain-containing protein [Deinococcus sp.]|uniref:S-layer homology domain-containing protein n=1 Tax=Deinococcus sp. TaxID=47478 RepID=UPI003C799955